MEDKDKDKSKKKKLKVKIKDFEKLNTVGLGSYGRVCLCKKKKSGKVYVMKILKKNDIIKQKQVDHVYSEYTILSKLKHPFIVQLIGVNFEDPKYIYFILEYIQGGELFTLLRSNVTFPVPQTKFYIAHIITVFEYLHSKNIVYRDLKPENILINKNGYLKLTDFGFAKQLDSEKAKTYTLCGTPEYLAPEIILNKGHGKPVDWWSLGNLIYEMLTGIPPFYCKDRDILFDAITNDEPEYPEYLSDEVIDLIKKLLIKNPDKRLGNNGADEIKKHIFFEGMNWEKLLNKKIKPPFIPRLKNAVDTKYIDPLFAKATPQDTPVDTYENVDEEFNGFSFNK